MKEDTWSGNSVFYSSFMREPASSLRSLGKSHLLSKDLLLWHFEKKNWKTLQHAGWQKMLQEMIINLIRDPSNYLFTVFSQCLWHGALMKNKRDSQGCVTTPNSSTNIQEVKLYFVHPDLHKTSLLACKQGMNAGLRKKGCVEKKERMK